MLKEFLERVDVRYPPPAMPQIYERSKGAIANLRSIIRKYIGPTPDVCRTNERLLCEAKISLVLLIFVEPFIFPGCQREEEEEERSWAAFVTSCE